MTHEDVFLGEILESPADDTPRLIYADWLEDQGQGDRADLIRVQCELAHLEREDPRRKALEACERDLLARHGEAWLGELRTFVTRWIFRRGFLAEVAVPARGYLAHAHIPYPPTVEHATVDLDGFEIPPEVLELMPVSVAREDLCLPLGFRGPALVLAVGIPHHPDVVHRMAFILNRTIEPVAADAKQVRDAIERHYGQTEVETVECVLQEFPVYGSEAPGESSPVVRLVEQILWDAVTRQATDVRIEAGPDHPRFRPRPDYFRVLHRVEDMWVERGTPPRRLLSALVSRIRVMAGLALGFRGEQTGRMSGTVQGVPFDCEVLIRPSEHGPRVFLSFATPEP